MTRTSGVTICSACVNDVTASTPPCDWPGMNDLSVTTSVEPPPPAPPCANDAGSALGVASSCATASVMRCCCAAFAVTAIAFRRGVDRDVEVAEAAPQQIGDRRCVQRSDAIDLRVAFAEARKIELRDERLAARDGIRRPGEDDGTAGDGGAQPRHLGSQRSRHLAWRASRDAARLRPNRCRRRRGVRRVERVDGGFDLHHLDRRRRNEDLLVAGDGELRLRKRFAQLFDEHPPRVTCKGRASVPAMDGSRTSMPCRTLRIACTSAGAATTINALARSSSRTEACGKSGRSTAAARLAATTDSGITTGPVAGAGRAAAFADSMSYTPCRRR